MKVRVKTVCVKELTFTGYEAQVIEHLLDYAYHRLAKHKHSGLEGIVTLEAVQAMRRGLNG